MAGIRKLRGKYYARVRINGREKLVPLNTTDLKTANRRLKFVNEHEWYLKIGWEKELNVAPLPTLFEASEMFVKESRNRGLTEKTIHHYSYTMEHFLKVIKGSWRIDVITEDRCKDLLVYLRTSLSPASVNSYLKSINNFINWLRKKYKIELPPKIKEIRAEKRLPEFFTPSELDRIYDICDNPKMLATFKVYEHTGIRLRELHNCELDESVSGNYVKLKNTKGKRERIIPIPPEIVEDFKIAKYGPYGHNLEKCEPYRPDHISHTFCKLRRKAVLKTFAESNGKDVDKLTNNEKKTALEDAGSKSIHSLRHTFALRKLLEWGNIYLVMQTLGHADVKTTQIYLEFPNGYIKEVFGKWIPDINGKLQNIKKTSAKA